MRKELDMKVSQSFALRLATIVLLAVHSISSYGQTESSKAQSPGIAVRIAMDRDHVPIDQIAKEPWAILTVKNLSDHIVSLHDLMVRIHVLGEKGERPMTRVQRTLTGKFLPGEAPLRVDENALWTITPGVASSHRYEVSYFYNIGEPDKYRVYMEVVDPTTRKRLRTKTVTFEIVAPDK